MNEGSGFLSGLTVLELGDGVSGGATTSLLVSLGATVTAVVDPQSAHRRGRPDVSADGENVALLSVVLDRGKRLVTAVGLDLPDVEELVARGADGAPFDLVVVDRVGGVAGPLVSLRDAEDYGRFVSGLNRMAWVSISAFGLSGPRRNDIATELTVAAAAGMLASVRDPGTGRPLKLAGYQSLLNTGQAGALAACQALDAVRDGGPAHMDVSASEATIAMGPTLAISTVILNANGLSGAKRYGAPASFYDCEDGKIRISAMEDHQWQGVVAAMGTPKWAERFAANQARIDNPEEIDERIAEWTAGLAKRYVETLLQSHGVPATAVYSPAETLDSPQMNYRSVFETARLSDGREALVVGKPFRRIVSPSQRPLSRSLRGLKVLEVGHVLAGPLAGSLLGAMGAEVTKLEDLKRLDMYRRRGPYIDETVGMERGAYFALVNHSKRSVAFDAQAEPARLAALLEATDVVLENVGGRRAVRLGIAATEVQKSYPDALAVSSSGFGLDGPHASYRAYAYNLQASCCLGFLTRNADGEAAEIDLPWADLISGFALATIIAAWAVGPEGNPGAAVDFAMADAIVGHFSEFVAAASLDSGSDALVDRANDLAPFAPHGVYETSDGWIAIAVDGDDQYDSLAKVLGAKSLNGPDFSDVAVRLANRTALDGALDAVTKSWLASQLALELRSEGIAAEQLLKPTELPSVDWLVERDFFTSVEHPDWGRRRLIGLPWRPFGQPAIALIAPPCLEP